MKVLATQAKLNLRPLTTIERSYLQTFPKNFIFTGSKTDLEQMIGNAVTVKLAEYVANCLLIYLQEKNQHQKYDFTLLAAN
uniref:DNA cytosine methyltransferase n=1 Tax=Okeanomitos corallinicola TaxID=3231550 RepID=UPI003EBE58BC